MKIYNFFNFLLILTFFNVLIIPCLNAQVTETIDIKSGWNLISLPLKVDNGAKSILFQDATSDAFIYQGSYVAKDTLAPGEGFWLKYDNPNIVSIIGEYIYLDTIDVREGWNIIGSLSMPITLDNITTIPPLNIVSDFFSYTSEQGYQSSDTIKPGVGYWVKVSEVGKIVLSGPYNNAPSQPSNPSPANYAIDTDTSITLSWSCSDPNDDPLTYDIYFGVDNPPSNHIITNHGDTTYALNALNATATYYWKVVARDIRGDSTIGPIWRFTTKYTDGGIHCEGLPFIVYESKTYNTVQIGDQCWLRENIDLGSMIDSLQNPSDNDIIEKYCYGNNPVNCEIYGGLYQWREAMQYTTASGSKGICPTGWHIPTLTEFNILNTIVGNDCNALKAIGQGTGQGAGTNTSGFAALQGGGLRDSHIFDCLEIDAGFWGSTEYNSSYAYYMFLGGTATDISLTQRTKEHGFSIRCIKD
jgi:uncharacterized protein (TIGR02145 family)